METSPKGKTAVWQRKTCWDYRIYQQKKIELILQTAAPMKDIIGRPIKGTGFEREDRCDHVYEPVPGPDLFEMAGKYLSADTVNLTMSSSSVLKRIRKIQPGQLIMVLIDHYRHEATGAPIFWPVRLPGH